MNYTNSSIDDENDDESREITAADSSTTARIATDTTCRNTTTTNNNNNNNNNWADNNANNNPNGGGSNRNGDGDKNWNSDENKRRDDTTNHVAQIKIKKEEIKEDIMDDNNNNACLANKNSIDDAYADWKTGNWCWLLPTTGNDNDKDSDNDNDKDKGDTNNRKRKSKQCKSLRDNNINEDEGSDVNYGDLAAGNNASIMNDDKEEEKEEPEPAKKKIRIKDNEEEADTAAVNDNCCIKEDKNNSRDNKDGDGYESWTKGNWCWLLPSSRSIEEKRLKSDNNTVQINNNSSNKTDDDDEELGIKQEGNNGNGGPREEYIIGHDVDNDNDNDNNNNSYESWTVGNWCWVLPHSSDDVIIEATEEHRRSNDVPAINETTNRLVRSSPRRRCSSSSALLLDVDDEYDDGDGNTDNDDDFENNYNERVTSKKGKYTRLQNEIWHEMFQRLIAYKKQHDSTNVSRSYKADIKLASWVHTQRICYKKNEMSEERINYLESIGFVWKIHEKLPWDEMFQRLVTYKKKFKSTSVPQRYSSDHYLGRWVNSQRALYNSEKLSVKRINLLDSIGFVWDPFDEQWMEMYHKLVSYKKQNRSTKVPCHYTEDPQLGTWVVRQRQVYNSTIPGVLTEKRLELLNSINFAWSGK